MGAAGAQKTLCKESGTCPSKHWARVDAGAHMPSSVPTATPSAQLAPPGRTSPEQQCRRQAKPPINQTAELEGAKPGPDSTERGMTPAIPGLHVTVLGTDTVPQGDSRAGTNQTQAARQGAGTLGLLNISWGAGALQRHGEGPIPLGGDARREKEEEHRVGGRSGQERPWGGTVKGEGLQQAMAALAKASPSPHRAGRDWCWAGQTLPGLPHSGRSLSRTRLRPCSRAGGCSLDAAMPGLKARELGDTGGCRDRAGD